ncbi:MAG: glycoside hydrolase family 15 protein, partial [Armatimonadota bacterium]|nr:glycoside hydrolase family 15 protein [Armatimonadota bacterium]
FGLLVADGQDFFSEEKRDTKNAIKPLAPGVPGYVLTNTCREGRYKTEKTIIADPKRDVLLQRIRFTALKGQLGDYQLYALLAPHLSNHGHGNDAWVGDYKGVPMLFAKRGDVALALACSLGWGKRSAGYVGVSDGWQDIHAHKKLTHCYDSAPHGNVALTGELTLSDGGECVLALGFGATWAEAGQQARASLLADFDAVAEGFAQGWQDFQKGCRDDFDAPSQDGFEMYRTSMAVLKTHDGKRFSGGVIASLSIPWGFAHGDKDLAGYHVVWPRDQVEAAGAMLAAGSASPARETLRYLICTQEADGHWPQNMTMDGQGFWTGLQLDETALPVLLADRLRRLSELGDLNPAPMVRAAADFLQAHGPSTPMDRWEENAGYSPFTLAVMVAALLAAADFAEGDGDQDRAEGLRQAADDWNGQIEDWTYVTGTELAKQHDVEGYYVRIAPPEVGEGTKLADAQMMLKNRPSDSSHFSASAIVSPDALALVRYGLRAPDDPRILNTVKVIDAVLKTDTQTGPVWHRYTHDGYGETQDGGPYEGAGVGRGWPLLAGERAHYELARGNCDEAKRLLHVMAAQTSPGGLLPEQVWDCDDLPEHDLFNGHPSGSGMPLVWAHAEFLKLLRSLKDGQVWDTPPQTAERYLKNKSGTESQDNESKID